MRLVIRRILTEPNRAARIVFSLVLIAMSVGVSLAHVPSHATISPIDEYVYIDYLAKVPSQLLVHHGEETGEYARSQLSCRGVRAIGFYPEDLCETTPHSNDAAFPTAGANTADIYTPLYFVATRILAEPLRWLGLDLTDAGRYTGCVWLALAAVLLYLTLSRLKIRPILAVGVAALLIGSLAAYWSNTYISTDATSLFAGALMIYLAVCADSGRRWSLWLLPVVASVMTLLKLQNFGAVVVVALFLCLRAGWGAFERTELGTWARIRGWTLDRRTRSAVLALIIPIICQAVWLLIRARLSVGSDGDQGTATVFDRNALFGEVFKFLTGPAGGALDPAILGYVGIILGTTMAWVSVCGVLGAIASSPRRSIGEALGICSLVVALLMGPALAYATLKTTGYYFILPPRYSMSLMPIFLVCTALVADKKRGVAYVVAAIGFGLFLLSLGIPES